MAARTDDSYDALVYQHDFDTVRGQWLTIRLMLSNFKPTVRGQASPRNTACLPDPATSLHLLLLLLLLLLLPLLPPFTC